MTHQQEQKETIMNVVKFFAVTTAIVLIGSLVSLLLMSIYKANLADKGILGNILVLGAAILTWMGIQGILIAHSYRKIFN